MSAEAPRWSAVALARALGQRYLPTPEQVEVIEAPLEPLLVVAGAGSGKTETMAARVVWLVANGHVRPEEVLGLTFTRKAAGELAERVRSRLRALRRRLPCPASSSPTSRRPGLHLPLLRRGRPADHGLRLGVEPAASSSARLRRGSSPQTWCRRGTPTQRRRQDAQHRDRGAAGSRRGVLGAPRGAGSGGRVHRCADRRIELGRCRGSGARMRAKRCATGWQHPPARRSCPWSSGTASASASSTSSISATRWRRSPLASTAPEVGGGRAGPVPGGAARRVSRTPSHAQLVLRRSSFGGGHSVTAVGDPHQSIYGWRGASAGTLDRFPTDFPDAPSRRLLPPVDELAQRRRRCSRPRTRARRRCAPPGPRWQESARRPSAAGPAPAPGAPRVARHSRGRGRVGSCGRDRTAGPGLGGGLDPPTTAVLVRARSRSQFPLVEAALRKRQLPIEVVGLGGLLHVPEAQSLVPTAGAAGPDPWRRAAAAARRPRRAVRPAGPRRR